MPVLGGETVTGINFDNAASTPPLKRVRDAVTAFSEVYSSVHRGTGYKSRMATEAYEQARERVAEFLHVDEQSQVVIFVKGTTDALNRIAAEEASPDAISGICTFKRGKKRFRNGEFPQNVNHEAINLYRKPLLSAQLLRVRQFA